jgi:hypothetical protein
MLPYGYIFKFEGHGVFDPDGKIEEPLSDLDIINHNTKLAIMEVESALKTGKALLYLYRDRTQSYSVGTWDGTYKFPCLKGKTSWHNFAGKDGRLDLWIKIKDQCWHGVNIGDNDIVYAKRIKSRR